jgi:hypothetical protein
MANLAAGALPAQPISSIPPAAAAMDPSLMLGADGNAAAFMAQLLAFRAELFAVHLSVKLFHCAPSDLPEDVREQLTGWLRSAPACTELYVCSGCVHLTVTVWRREFAPCSRSFKIDLIYFKLDLN